MRSHWWAGNSGLRTDEVCRRRQQSTTQTLAFIRYCVDGSTRQTATIMTDNNNMNINHFSDKGRLSRKQCMQRVFFTNETTKFSTLQQTVNTYICSGHRGSCGADVLPTVVRRHMRWRHRRQKTFARDAVTSEWRRVSGAERVVSRLTTTTEFCNETRRVFWTSTKLCDADTSDVDITSCCSNVGDLTTNTRRVWPLIVTIALLLTTAHLNSTHWCGNSQHGIDIPTATLYTASW